MDNLRQAQSQQNLIGAFWYLLSCKSKSSRNFTLKFYPSQTLYLTMTSHTSTVCPPALCHIFDFSWISRLDLIGNIPLVSLTPTCTCITHKSIAHLSNSFAYFTSQLWNDLPLDLISKLLLVLTYFVQIWKLVISPCYIYPSPPWMILFLTGVTK